jgi:hypothetical protein
MRHARTIALCLLLCLSWPLPAGAEGALAVGVSKNRGQDNGVVWGSSTNWASPDLARRAALQNCIAAADTDDLKQSCYVISDVNRGCIGFAAAPDGQFGFGWGIGPNVQTAKFLAMEMCKSTAGPAGAGACTDATDGNLFNVCDRDDHGRQIKDGNATSGKMTGRRAKQ